MAAPAAEGAPAIPGQLGDKLFMNVLSVCCGIDGCQRYANAVFIPGTNSIRLTCHIAEHAYERNVINNPPEARLVHDIESSIKVPYYNIVDIGCPNAPNAGENELPCQGQKCTLYKKVTAREIMEFLVCHSCGKYWRVTN